MSATYPVTLADFEAHLRWQQSAAARGDWTRADDWRLVEGVLRRGLPAADLRRTEAACRQRWFALYPPELHSLRFQEAMVRQLRAGVGA